MILGIEPPSAEEREEKSNSFLRVRVPRDEVVKKSPTSEY